MVNIEELQCPCCGAMNFADVSYRHDGYPCECQECGHRISEREIK